MQLKTTKTDVLEIAYLEYGDANGWPCVMAHGFPFDVHAYHDVAPLIADAGARVIVPYLRGYGPTRFLSEQTLRSGEQAVLGADLVALMDALNIKRAVLGGYDWGGRAACIVAALWPERVEALVTGNSYNIQNIAKSMQPAPAEEEAAYWYQYYFHTQRGFNGLTENRRGIARLLWQMWSPTWKFDDATFERSAGAFDNPDFVDVVIHSYRHRYGLVAGDPSVQSVEQALAQQPAISVATVSIDGAVNGVHGSTQHHSEKFTGPHQHRVFDDTGHNLPQERPEQWTTAVLDARKMSI